MAIFTGHIMLTNPRNIPCSLSNLFDNEYELEEIVRASNENNIVKNVNKCSKYRIFDFYKNFNNRIVLKAKDSLGNIDYLILYKEEQANDKLSAIKDEILIMELIKRGYQVSKA